MGKHEDILFENLPKKTKGVKQVVPSKKPVAPISSSQITKDYSRSLKYVIIVLIAILIVMAVFKMDIFKEKYAPDTLDQQQATQQARQKTEVTSSSQAPANQCFGLQAAELDQCQSDEKTSKALKENNPELCGGNQDCLNQVYYNSDSVCSGLRDQELLACLTELRSQQAVKEDNPGLCKGDVICLDVYYFQQANLLLDIIFCDEITSPELKEGCIETIGTLMKAENPEQFVTSFLSTKEVSKTLIDDSSCSSLEEFEASKCFDNLVTLKATDETNVTFCQLHSNQVYCNDFVSNRLSIIYADTSYCKSIVDTKLKGECQG